VEASKETLSVSAVGTALGLNRKERPDISSNLSLNEITILLALLISTFQ
jgi:hypothetical protein